VVLVDARDSQFPIHGRQLAHGRPKLVNLLQDWLLQVVPVIRHPVSFDTQARSRLEHLFSQRVISLIHVGGHHTDLDPGCLQGFDQLRQVLFDAFWQHQPTTSDGRLDALEAKLSHSFGKLSIAELLDEFHKCRNGTRLLTLGGLPRRSRIERTQSSR